MAHFAKLDENNNVIEVHVVNNAVLDPENEEATGIAFLTEWSNGHTNWRQTSYNNNFRKQYAGVNYFYDLVADVFVAPQPYPSWSLDKNFDWNPPIAKPEGNYDWDESTLSWIEIEA